MRRFRKSEDFRCQLPDRLGLGVADDRHHQPAGRLGGDAASRPKPARVAVPNGKYKVQPNDNYWTISEKVYGSGNYFKAIHEHNRVQHPESDSLSVGEVIRRASLSS